MPLPGGIPPAGKHFIANISTDQKMGSGIEVINRDPRTWRFPPDAYSSRIEEAGPRCSEVKVGDIATIERRRWLQMDIDDERICGSEDHVLLVNGIPVNGVLAILIIDDGKKYTGALNLPFQEREIKSRPYYHGKVISSSVKEVREKDELWLQKSDKDQWKLGGDKLIFRWDNPSGNSFSSILAIRHFEPMLEILP